MQSSVLSSLSTSPSLARYSDREHSRPSQLSSITASSTQSSSTSSALDSATGTHNDHGDVVRKSIRNENPGKWKIYNKPKLIIRLTNRQIHYSVDSDVILTIVKINVIFK